MPRNAHPQGLSLAPGYHSVNPYFLVRGVESFIAFLTEVFDGREETKFKEVRPDGLIDHADVFIGDSIVMMSDADATNSPRPSVAFVYVPDVDATYEKALDRGCVSRLEPTVAPWGERVAGFTDPWDNRWWIGVPAPGVAGV
jgi:PhnB protein